MGGWGQDPWGLTPWGGGGTVTITGTPQVDYTLTATAGFTAYQWYSSPDGATFTPIPGAATSTFPVTGAVLGLFLQVVADFNLSNVVGPVAVFVEANPGTDSYVGQFFRDNGRNQYSVEQELWVTPGQRRRPHGRRVR